MERNNKACDVPYEGFCLPPTEDELFQLSRYPIFDKKELMELLRGHDENFYQELMSSLRLQMHNAEEDFISAHEKKDWKTIKWLADRERDSALYCGARRLRYACQFLEYYCERSQTALLEALYEQALNVMVQTRNAIDKVN
jgi:hypothetical protein